MESINYIVYKGNHHLPKAIEIGAKTGAKVFCEKEFLDLQISGHPFYFYLSDENFRIIKYKSGDKGISVDFVSKQITGKIKTLTIKNPLAKAIGIRGNKNLNPFVLDATAGLGKDSFFIFSLGVRVVGFERNPFLFYLLENGLDKYLLFNSSEKGLKFFNFDSRFFLKSGEADIFFSDRTPDVIYIDPMYPMVRKKAVKPKKEMVYLREINGDDDDSAELFKLCLEYNCRVVVKRPVLSETISNFVKPAYNIGSKLVRYDVYK